MGKPTESEKELLENIKSEISASGTLSRSSSEDRAYNEGIFKAAGIVQRYIDGKGIFQID